MPRQDDPSKHVTIMTMKCTKLLVIVPILCLIFFVHMVCGIFTQDLSIFLSSCHCHAHTWHRFLESAETQCYICTYVYDFFHSQLLVWSIVTLDRMQWAKFSNLKGHTLKNETFNSNQQIERKGRKSWYRKILKLVIRSYSRTATDL